MQLTRHKIRWQISDKGTILMKNTKEVASVDSKKHPVAVTSKQSLQLRVHEKSAHCKKPNLFSPFLTQSNPCGRSLFLQAQS
jgi:hypothetical protein